MGGDGRADALELTLLLELGNEVAQVMVFHQ
jgi:hypothetical protein